MIGVVRARRDTRAHAELLRLQMKYLLYLRDWFQLADYLRTLPGAASPDKLTFFRLSRETAIALSTHEAERYPQLRARWRREFVADPDDAVQFLFALGDSDGALGIVQSAVNVRPDDALLTDPRWESLFNPNLAPLRRDPRVPVLVSEWRLLDYWRTTGHWPDFVR